MSPQLDSPVQTLMSVSILKSSLVLDCHGSQRVEEKQPLGRRRVFVQTETGCLLGLELDRRDSAHTVKRKMQLVLNVPTKESSLTFGDMVLDDDLSAIQKDSSLLLTRNQMHRSSSTPCLSPSGREIQLGDTDCPIEILGNSKCFDSTRQIVRDIVKAVKHGVDPLPVKNGLGGAYYFKNIRGDNVAVVKPTDEEPFAPNNPKGFVGMSLGQPGLKHSVRVGETGVREVAAYLLDDGHFANVPATALVKVTHSIFNVNRANGNRPSKKKLVSKIASLQQFIPHDFDASDYGTSSFPVSAVHRIGILDIRIFNTDRHGGNILVRKRKGGVGMFGLVELIPIDHGLCLPESLEDPYFEWIHWPQASIPFSEEEIEYIKNLDPAQDCKMLRKELPMIREACLRVLELCTIFLKEATFYGLCLAEIGEMMTREFRNGDEEPSKLESICLEAKRIIAAEKEQVLSPRSQGGGEEFLFDIEYEDLGWHFTLKSGRTDFLSRSPFSTGIGNGKNRLSRLEESDEEDENEGEEIFGAVSKAKFSSAKSFNSASLGGKIQKGKLNASIGHSSADEQLPTSPCFVELADMAEEEWDAFLLKLKELLPPAFVRVDGERLRQRLGTSCKF